MPPCGVKPATLQLLMRHRSIETTLKYYVAQNADDVADELWREHRRRVGGDRGGPQESSETVGEGADVPIREHFW